MDFEIQKEPQKRNSSEKKSDTHGYPRTKVDREFDWSHKRDPRISNKDWVARCYELGHKHNFNDCFTLTQEDRRSGERVSYHCSHRHWDAGSAFPFILSKLGYDTARPPMGKSRKLGFLQKFRNFLLIFKLLFKKSSNPWDYLDTSHRLRPQRGESYFFHLDEMQSRRLRKRAKWLKSSENGLILEAINRRVAKKLIRGRQRYKWLIPVNMRGAISPGYNYINASSGISLELNSNSTAQEITYHLKSKLQEGEHWAIWNFFQWTKFLSDKLLNSLLQYRAQNSFQMGSYTHLGNWEVARGENELWYLNPPGTPNFPVSVGVINWNRKICISLKLHPALGVSIEDFYQISDQIRRDLVNL